MSSRGLASLFKVIHVTKILAFMITKVFERRGSNQSYPEYFAIRLTRTSHCFLIQNVQLLVRSLFSDGHYFWRWLLFWICQNHPILSLLDSGEGGGAVIGRPTLEF